MTQNLRLGVAGLGNVGVGLIKLVQSQSTLKIPGELSISGVCARSRGRDRGVDVSGYSWFDDPVALATADDVDVYVELIGGSDGPAKTSVEAALTAGKHVVTANKALIAEHGVALAELAEQNNAHLLFEAAVAGGIPIVRAIRDSLSGVRVERISGILNGTCNYILTEMMDKGAPYDDVLKEAQQLGYAEADPWLDVSGTDAAHKIAILAAIAFGARPDFSKVRVRGVSNITDLDIQLARKLGYCIRLSAEAARTNGNVRCFTTPTLYSLDHPMAHVVGPTNAVIVDAEPVGRLTFTGAGAGEGPTASAVLGDISRIFHGAATAPFGVPTAQLADMFAEPTGDKLISPWFIRARLADRSGALAQISDALANMDISVDQLLQESAKNSGTAPVAIVTHACTRKTAESVVERIANLPVSVDAPQLIRIEA